LFRESGKAVISAKPRGLDRTLFRACGLNSQCEQRVRAVEVDRRNIQKRLFVENWLFEEKALTPLHVASSPRVRVYLPLLRNSSQMSDKLQFVVHVVNRKPRSQRSLQMVDFSFQISISNLRF
jgi:hypothetical protein